MSDIVVERLRELANLKTGDPPPSWLPDNNWGPPLCELARQAVNLIEGAYTKQEGAEMSDIVERLREFRQTGNMFVDQKGLDFLLGEAADTIERLRSIAGKADVGPSFAEIAKDLPRRANEPADPS